MMPQFSVIVPVYNRPEEIDELLRSIAEQNFPDIEVIIVEDGSTESCKFIVDSYRDEINIKYFSKKNTGQGFSRNFGAEQASGTWLVFFDSDCVIPNKYFIHLERLIQENDYEAFCGPDSASSEFSNLQKSISYAMTSLFTTGGIRGGKNSTKKVGSLRSYNMVASKMAFNSLKGFAKTNMGEDMEFSHRFYKKGYQALISNDIFVYHKRRNSLKSFFKQIFSFGRTRVILKRDFGLPIKGIHCLPALYAGGFFVCLLGAGIGLELAKIGLGLFCIHAFIILIDSSIKSGRLLVGLLSVITSFIQLSAYGLGMIKELLFKEIK